MNIADLIALSDARSLTGFTPFYLNKLSGTDPLFPRPTVVVGNTRLFQKTELQKWAEARRRRIGRRRHLPLSSEARS